MPETYRQLAAIMFTDIAGYTKLMGEDEEKAFELLDKNRLVQRPIIERFNGRWLKEIGDGVLASFSTVSDAVYCAGAIQKSCEDQPDLKLRIGIHLGEVVFKDDDVFGDGVNIASRLEPLAPIGGILVSESVNRDLGNKKGIETNFVGEETLKNVKDPIKVYTVKVEGAEDYEPISSTSQPLQPDKPKSSNRKKVLASAGIVIILALTYLFYINRNDYGLPDSSTEPQTIAVLAFDDQSPNGDQEWLGDGMAEEILNVLGNVNGLQVTGRTSSFSFKGKGATITEIGEALNVKAVLEGSVSKMGNKLRITAQLIDVESDKHIWSNKYDRDAADIFTIMDEVAQSIASSLISELSPEQLEDIKIGYKVDPEAYEYYLKGDHFNRYNFKLSGSDYDFEQSEEMFINAINIDPNYADAYAGLADLYSLKSTFDNNYHRKGDSLVNIAYRINPKSAIVLMAKGMNLQGLNLDSAFYYFRKAYNHDLPRHFNTVIGELYARIGLYENAISFFSGPLMEIDPLNVWIKLQLANSLIFQGRIEEAKLNLEKIIEIEKNKPPQFSIDAYDRLFRLALRDKDTNEAERIHQAMEQLTPTNFQLEHRMMVLERRKKQQLAMLLAAEGKREEALNTFPYPNVVIYSLLNMKKEVLLRVDSMSIKRDYSPPMSYTNLKNVQFYDLIREEPRFKEILAKAKKVHEERLEKYGHLFDE